MPILVSSVSDFAQKFYICLSSSFSAEALDNHLTAIQRDHEVKSQIEERKIRNDAAHEEAKRKEKALHQEKLRQERAKAEAEVHFLILSSLSNIIL